VLLVGDFEDAPEMHSQSLVFKGYCVAVAAREGEAQVVDRTRLAVSRRFGTGPMSGILLVGGASRVGPSSLW
jgi:hypothetical protein